MILAAALTFVFQSDVRIIELSDGSTGAYGAAGPKYWSCSDTFIVSSEADANFGGSHLLLGGPGRTILIKFGDLDRVALSSVKVRSATLVLTPASEGVVQLNAVKRLLVPWGEGPVRTLMSGLGPKGENRASPLSATWRSRRAGSDSIQWQQPGATGPGDGEAILGAKVETSPEAVRLTGLASAFQTMFENWYENHGLALSFSSPIEFYSSKAGSGKPKLILEIERIGKKTGPDLSVTLIELRQESVEGTADRWPKDGENVTYRAHIKNVGDQPSTGFTATWVVRERSSSSVDYLQTIAPGAKQIVELKKPFKNEHSDHRLQSLGLKIRPRGADAVSANDYLEIQESGLPITLHVAPKAAESVYGSSSNEDSGQYLLRVINETMLAESRYSFAPDGALERFRIQKVVEYEGSGDQPSYRFDVPFQELVGLPALGKLNRLKLSLIDGGKPVLRFANDRFPGINAGGCTLLDHDIPGTLSIAYDSASRSNFEEPISYGLGMLSMTEVAALNHALGKSRSTTRQLGPFPAVTVVRALSLDGRSLPNVELAFFQSVSGEIPNKAPDFTVTTGADGTFLLPTRQAPEGAKRDAFGGFLPSGENGVYLIRATVHGVSEWTSLKAWQLADAAARAGRPVVNMELRFNVPSQPIDTETNVALNRVVADSKDSLPTSLAPIVDGVFSNETPVINDSDAWLEIDLGRDRPIAEIILGLTSFWQQFDIVTYTTGQTAADAQLWNRENDFGFSSTCRADPSPPEAPDILTVAYRGLTRRARYVRFVCRKPSRSAGASLREIVIHAARSIVSP